MNFRSPSSDESRGYALRARHPSCSETTLQRKEDEPGKRGLRSNGRTILFGGWGFQWQFLGYRPSDVQLVSKWLWWALGCFLPSCGFTGSDALRRSKYTGRHPTQVREGGLERNGCGGSTLTSPPPLSLRVRLSFRSIVFLVCLCKPIADGCFAALLRCRTGSPLSSEPDRTEGSSDGGEFRRRVFSFPLSSPLSLCSLSATS